MMIIFTLGVWAIMSACTVDHGVLGTTANDGNLEDAQVNTVDPSLLQELTANFASILQSLTKLEKPHGYQNSMTNQQPKETPVDHLAVQQIKPEPFTKQIPLDARDCNDVAARGHYGSGIYMVRPHIYPVNQPINQPDTTDRSFAVYCDMVTDGGNWTVFHRRQDALVGFFRGWDEYKEGFGYLDGDHWLGLERLHQMTVHYKYELRVDLEDFAGNKVYAKYDNFQIGDESTAYTLTIGAFNGTAKDSLTYHGNMPFSTKDRDNDHHQGSCAKDYKGAWWYNSCHYANLNGLFKRTAKNSNLGMTWYAWKKKHESLKQSQMKIRRLY